MSRYVFLNALPLNALKIEKPTRLIVSPVKPDVLKQLADMMLPVECYIRHPATVDLLNKLFGFSFEPSNQLYEYRRGDVIYVVTLKKPVRGQEAESVSLKDLEIFQVEVIE